jgi:uncharacterized cupin superfamily protein
VHQTLNIYWFEPLTIRNLLMTDIDKLFASCVIHHSKIASADNNHYPNDDELLGIDAPFSEHFSLMQLGIFHETLLPGRRTSWPHAEADEEEFIYVLEGAPDLWLNGHVRQLKPGDGVGFPIRTGIAHTFINNTDKNVCLLVVGEASRRRTRIDYPLHPKRNAEVGTRHWKDKPPRELGPHDGMPDALRKPRS